MLERLLIPEASNLKLTVKFSPVIPWTVILLSYVDSAEIKKKPKSLQHSTPSKDIESCIIAFFLSFKSMCYLFITKTAGGRFETLETGTKLLAVVLCVKSHFPRVKGNDFAFF